MKIRKVVRRKGFLQLWLWKALAWMALLYLIEGHAVSCDSYQRKTAKTIFTSSCSYPRKLSKPLLPTQIHSQEKLPKAGGDWFVLDQLESGQYVAINWKHIGSIMVIHWQHIGNIVAYMCGRLVCA